MYDTVRKLQETCVYQEEGLEYLKGVQNLTGFQKNCIWTACYPTNIGDYELPGLIREERGEHPEGFLVPKEREILLLLRAYSCGQYGGYMKHLLWAFTKNPESIKVPGHREVGENLDCGICGKVLYPWDEWESKCQEAPAFRERERREFLAYASELSSQCMCLNCQVQMNALLGILKEIGLE